MNDRKTKLLPPGTFGGRDANKAFVLTEMDAMRAERWGRRALQLLAGSLPLSADLGSEGMAAVAAIGFSTVGNMTGTEADALLDDLLACVQFLPDPKQPDMRSVIVEGVISEPMTVLRLRKEAFDIHTNFSEAAAPFISAMATLLALKLTDIKTYLQRAASSSADG